MDIRERIAALIPQGSGEWSDYETGKELAASEVMTASEYESFIKWLTEYVGV